MSAVAMKYSRLKVSSEASLNKSATSRDGVDMDEGKAGYLQSAHLIRSNLPGKISDACSSSTSIC